MEQDLMENKIENLGINDYFKFEYENQDVKNKPEFKKWYKNAKEKIHKENLKRSKEFLQKEYDPNDDYRILTIGFCKKCMSYIICSITDYSFCYVKCNICQQTFCIGCFQELSQDNYFLINDSTCLKGYLKAFYLRIIYRRSSYERTNACYFIMHIIICLFITPLYIGFLSNLVGLIIHPKKIRKVNYSKRPMLYKLVYSIFRGFLMFPYIISFFPFSVILLLPGIFSYRYYLYIYNAYLTALFAGPYSLENVGDN